MIITLDHKGLRFARFPRYTSDGVITLKPVGFSDVPFLKQGLAAPDVHISEGTANLDDVTWPAAWWWFKTAFPVSYCIEINKKRSGFIGLYDIRRDRSAKMCMILFEEGHRHSGYGKRAARLFLSQIKQCVPVERLIVRVRIENTASLSFWKGLGFRTVETRNGIQTMVNILRQQ